MAYQSFDGNTGDSASSEKLSRLEMPRSLLGKSFLDLGANEGFFCVEARTRGASIIVGIDSNLPTIEKARLRSPGIDFRHQTWEKLPEGQFDLILLASALHYEQKPRELLSRISLSLADDGLFILEAGAVTRPDKAWVEAKRFDVSILYPTLPLLMEDLLYDYSVRLLGPSVDQRGDPIPRFVFHCKKYKPTVVIVPGESGSGKTTFATELCRGGISKFSTDLLVREIAHAAYNMDSALYRFIKENYDSRSIDLLTKKIIQAGMAKEFATLCFRTMPKNARVTVVEGYSFSDDAVLGHFIDLLRRAQMKVWVASSR